MVMGRDVTVVFVTALVVVVGLAVVVRVVVLAVVVVVEVVVVADLCFEPAFLQLHHSFSCRLLVKLHIAKKSIINCTDIESEVNNKNATMRINLR